MATSALYLLLLSESGLCYLVSPSGSTTPPPTAYPAAARDQVAQSLQLRKRATTDYCDSQGIFHCPTGTCYEYQGLIGCCSVSSCAPRTTCIEYDPQINSEPCDRDTGGCLYCNDPSAPHCRTQTNQISSQYNHYCDAVGGIVTVTTGPLAASLTQATVSVEDSEALPTNVATSTSISTKIMPASETYTTDASPERSPSYGAIPGIVCGIAAVLVLAAAALWYFWSMKRSQRKEKEDKSRTMANMTPPPISPDRGDNTVHEDRAMEKGSSPPASVSHGDTDTNRRQIDDLGSPTSTLAYNAHDGKRYTVTNPDLQPISPTESSIRDSATSYASAVEAPSDRPVLSSSPSNSPNISNHATPLWAYRQFNSPNTAQTPYTPSQYHASAPNSIAKPFLQPPSLPQDHSAATFASDATRAPAGLYTPSNYQPGPPESVVRTALPNLPQEYSTATLSSDNPNGSPVYRGLRSSSFDGFPPYAYLSPEDALAGGWTNDSPPRGEHRTGLEEFQKARAAMGY